MKKLDDVISENCWKLGQVESDLDSFKKWTSAQLRLNHNETMSNFHKLDVVVKTHTDQILKLVERVELSNNIN